MKISGEIRIKEVAFLQRMTDVRTLPMLRYDGRSMQCSGDEETNESVAEIKAG